MALGSTATVWLLAVYAVNHKYKSKLISFCFNQLNQILIIFDKISIISASALLIINLINTMVIQRIYVWLIPRELINATNF